MTTTSNLKFVQGDSKVLRVTAKTSAGVAVNLAGASGIRYRLAKSVKGTALIDKAMGTGIAITDAANGVLEVTLLPADTVALKGEYLHELELVDADGNVVTVFQGTVTLLPGMIT